MLVSKKCGEALLLQTSSRKKCKKFYIKIGGNHYCKRQATMIVKSVEKFTNIKTYKLFKEATLLVAEKI